MIMTDAELTQLWHDQCPAQLTSSLVMHFYEFKKETPVFTGWKPDLEEFVPPSALGPYDIPEEWRIGYVAQWIYIAESGDGMITLAVNLPSMERSKKLSNEAGAKFNIGSERVYGDTPPEELRELIKRGFGELMEMVADEKAEKTSA